MKTFINPLKLKPLKRATLPFAIVFCLLSCQKDEVQPEIQEPTPIANKSPIAVAGPDQVIALDTNSVMLDGSTSSDPDGIIITWLWEKTVGPDIYTIESPSTSSTIVKDLVVGNYIFQLKVTDNSGYVATDYLQVTVNPSPGPPIAWQKAIGGTGNDIGYSIQPTADGGYILVGITSSLNGDITGYHDGTSGCFEGCFGQTTCDNLPDGLVVKLNSAGDIQWQKALGGTGADNLFSIKPTVDGGYIASGYTNSNDGDVSGYHGGDEADAWVVKLNGIGDIQWQKVLGGSTGCDFANDILSTPDGGYIMVGHTDSNDGDIVTALGARDVWLVKLSSTGTIEWQKSLGGSMSDYAYSLKATTDGGYIAAGYTYSSDGDVSGHHGDADAWIIKLSGSGSIEWQKSLGGSQEEIARCIQLTADGGYIVAASTKSNSGDVTRSLGDIDAWIIKLNANGAIDWQKSFGGVNEDIARSVQQTSDGGYVLTGSTESNNFDVSGQHGAKDAWIVRLSSDGTLIWQKPLGGSGNDFTNAILNTADDGFIIAGQTQSYDGNVSGLHGGIDVWVVKL